MRKKSKGIVCAKLKGVRTEKGLSMEDICNIVGCSKSIYCQKENGQRPWKSTEMAILRKYFDMPADILFQELFYT